MYQRRTLPILVAAVVLAGCTDETLSPLRVAEAPSLAVSPMESTLAASINDLNGRLAAARAPVALARAEFSLANGDPNTVTTVFAHDRQLRLESRWVHGDPLRLDGTVVSYGHYLPLATANGIIDGVPPIDRSMATWNRQTCSNLPVVKKTVPVGEVPSLLLGFGFDFLPSVDIAQLGFLPGGIFDIFFGSGASSFILGVTWTFVWGEFDEDGVFTPSDIDRDRRLDTAFKEIWYNDFFTWTDTGAPGAIDIETVALHENGHALELGHFGRVAITNGRLVVSPRAVMNAFIIGVLRDPLGTDTGAYCGNWGSWGKVSRPGR